MSVNTRPALRFAIGLAAALIPSISSAQFPQPRLLGVFPAGGRAGETVEVQVHGADLERADDLWFDHPGLRAFRRKPGVFVVAIAPGTPIGRHDVRAVGPLGVSNPRVFVVGDRPESREAEPNNDAEHASPIAWNSVANGQLAASPDVDCFALDGRAGQRALIELDAERIDSRLDGVLQLHGPDGRPIALSHDYRGPDPFLDVTLPADGRYTIQVRDVVFGGSADHSYRLTLHDGPYVDAASPAVVAPGPNATLVLQGRNLQGGTPDPALAIDRRPLETASVTFAPAEPSFGSPLLQYILAPQAGRLGWQFGTDGHGSAVFVASAVDPVIAEMEPNDADHPQAVSLPCDVAGTFGAPGDEDVFRFTAKAGQAWWIEATAEGLGSPADPSFVVQKVDDKGVTQDLASGDDLADPSHAGDARFPTTTVDAALRWQAPGDGSYQVVLQDLFASQRGDARFRYRLNIRPERPDFRLFVVPDDAAQPGAVNLRAGGRATARLVVQRLDGFSGPIRVEPLELPFGVSCDPVTIGPGQHTAPVVFTAAAEARPVVGPASLVGRALAGDRKDVLEYAPGKTKLGPEVVRAAVPGGMVWPPMPVGNGPPPLAVARVTHGLVLAVGEAAPFRLDVRPERLVLKPGESAELAVEVVRNPGMTEAIALTTADLPPNAPAANATIAKGEAKATIKLTVPANVAPGQYSFVLRGTGPFPFNKDPNAKDKPNLNVNEPSNPIALSIFK